MNNIKRDWIISVGGGYGEYIFNGTEEEAEQERCRKANYEHAVARKLPVPKKLTDAVEREKARAEVAEADAAAMREAVEKHCDYVCRGPGCTHMNYCPITRTFSSTVGAALLKRLRRAEEALEEVSEWWDRIYPPDVYTGESGDVGAVEVIRIRGMIKAALAGEVQQND